MKTQTCKAQRRTIHISDIPLEVAMLPDGSYVFSQTEVAAVVDKPEIYIRRFLQSKWVKAFPELNSKSDSLPVDGSKKPIAPVSPELAALYWHKCANEGNKKAQALVIALVKRSVYELADEAFGVKCSIKERDLLLAEDLSDAGVARIEAMRQSLNQQLLDSHSESLSERELKLKIELIRLELERDRLQQCACNNGLTVKDVNKIGTVSWEVVNWVRNTLDSPTELAAVQEIERLGYGFDNECWLQVKLIDSFWVLPWRAFHSLTARVKHLPHQPNQ